LLQLRPFAKAEERAPVQPDALLRRIAQQLHATAGRLWCACSGGLSSSPSINVVAV
jgi:hypothetical protein